MTQRLRRLAVLGTALLAAVVSTGTSPGGEHRSGALVPTRAAAVAVDGKVSIVVGLKSSRRGSFSARGLISDTGVARGRQAVSASRARLALTLRGANGTIHLLVTQTCGRAKSTWKVVSGSGTYKGLSGAGVGKGRLVCGQKAPHRGVYTGSIQTPPPPSLATPGTYRGSGFDPNFRVTLEVTPDGRTITNVSFRQVVARCQPPAVTFRAPRFSARYPIGADRTFTIASEGYLISGEVSPGRVKGTFALVAGGCSAGPLNWSATTPPTALPPAPVGRYCGFMLTGGGICLDATADAWVTNIRLGATIRCVAPEAASFAFEYTYEGAIALRPDLTFAVNLADIPLQGGGSMRFVFSGRLDGGEATGTTRLTRLFLVRDSTRYQCRSVSATWSAKRGA